jgi:hypothetical protein
VDGAAATPVDGVPDGGGFKLAGAVAAWRLSWSDEERGWLLSEETSTTLVEVGRTTSMGAEAILSPASVLLADGRLFRLAMTGASSPRFELGRWDVPGAYLVGRSDGGAWELTRTAAGEAQNAPIELVILTCAEIGRLDGWFADSSGGA